MRFTVAVDPNLIEEAKRLSGAKTKREAIEMTLKEMIRRHHLKQAAAHAGKINMTISPKNLQTQRTER